MGDNMSKRLKLISVTEAEMEERSFPNPYTDWDQGVLTSSSGAEVDYNEPFDGEGKVSSFVVLQNVRQHKQGLSNLDIFSLKTPFVWILTYVGL